MAQNWPQIERAAASERKELVLTGNEEEPGGVSVCKRIESLNGALPTSLFDLGCLNLLEISAAGLCTLPPAISRLEVLNRLSLHSNKLTTLPHELGQLSQLVYLDLSANELTTVPTQLQNLALLRTLNLSNNKLDALPDLSMLNFLCEVNFSFNQLDRCPAFLLGTDCLSKLHTVQLRANRISDAPVALTQLAALKSLDMRENQLVEIPKEWGELKVKELLLAGNPLKDRRLAKLIADQHHKITALLDYIHAHCKSIAEEGSVGGGDNPTAKAKKGRKRGAKGSATVAASTNENDEIELVRDEIEILLAAPEKEFRVVKEESVSEVRPHIACCIVRDVTLNSDGLFKKFIAVQNKLHDDEAVCKKRVAATIATHDLSKLTPPLKYSAKKPEELKITPLRSSVEVTGAELVAQLLAEAEVIRKKEKRNNFSGIYKYLNLVKPMTVYPCLQDTDGKVLSFAPVTNSELSKMSADTHDLLLEVSSGESAATCKRVLDRLIVDMLTLGVGGEADTHAGNKLTLEQVKVVTESGEMRVAYPDRLDLSGLAHIDVSRKVIQ